MHTCRQGLCEGAGRAQASYRRWRPGRAAQAEAARGTLPATDELQGGQERRGPGAGQLQRVPGALGARPQRAIALNMAWLATGARQAGAGSPELDRQQACSGAKRPPVTQPSAPCVQERTREPQLDVTMTTLAFLFPALGGLLFGFDIGATSGAIISITSQAHSGTSWCAGACDISLLVRTQNPSTTNQ